MIDPDALCLLAQVEQQQNPEPLYTWSSDYLKNYAPGSIIVLLV